MYATKFPTLDDKKMRCGENFGPFGESKKKRVLKLWHAAYQTVFFFLFFWVHGIRPHQRRSNLTRQEASLHPILRVQNRCLLDSFSARFFVFFHGFLNSVWPSAGPLCVTFMHAALDASQRSHSHVLRGTVRGTIKQVLVCKYPVFKNWSIEIKMVSNISIYILIYKN